MDDSFASLLRRSRIAARLTQEELAEKSGLSARTVQAIERGEVTRPRRVSVRLLADALNLCGTTRTLFETAARPGSGSADGAGSGGPHPCGSIDEVVGCLLRQLGGADPAAPLLRLLRALTVDRDGYGLAGSLVPNHTLPVHALPDA